MLDAKAVLAFPTVMPSLKKGQEDGPTLFAAVVVGETIAARQPPHQGAIADTKGAIADTSPGFQT